MMAKSAIRYAGAGTLFEGQDVDPRAPLIERIDDALSGPATQATGG